MKSKKAAWMALREPVTFRHAAVLLGVSLVDLQKMVGRLDLLTIEVRGRRLIPVCELLRLRPR